MVSRNQGHRRARILEKRENPVGGDPKFARLDIGDAISTRQERTSDRGIGSRYVMSKPRAMRELQIGDA